MQLQFSTNVVSAMALFSRDIHLRVFPYQKEMPMDEYNDDGDYVRDGVLFARSLII